MFTSARCLRLVFALALAGLVHGTANAQDQVFTKAFSLYQAGKIAEARDVLLASMSQRPTALDYSLLGSIEFQETRFTEAERHLGSALEKEPKLLGTRFTLATLLEVTGKPGEAAKELEQVIALDPHQLDALLALARLRTAESHFAIAATLLNRAAALAPKDVRPLLGLARVRNLEGNSEGALALLLKAKAISPEDPAVLFSLGALCLQMDLIKDGTANLERAAALDPANPGTQYALASARVANRDFPAAIKIYEIGRAHV